MNTEDIRTMYAFNRWANQRVLSDASSLANDDFTRNVNTSHASVQGTLVHVLWGGMAVASSLARPVAPLGHMMQHVVNHSSYHSGQVVTLLRQMGQAPRATDLRNRFGRGLRTPASSPPAVYRPRQPQAGPPPLALDEFLEAIPFPETRNYVKRVTILRATYSRIAS